MTLAATTRCLTGGALLLSLALAAAPGGAVEDGREVPRRDPAETFAENCASCHKGDGRGGPGYGGYAANLRTTALTAEEIVEVVIEGRQNRGMPLFTGVLEPGEIADLAAFILIDLRDPPEEGEPAG